MFVRSSYLLTEVRAREIPTAGSVIFLNRLFYWFLFTMAFQTIKPFHANLLSFYSFRDPTGLTLHYVLWSDTPPALKSPAIEKETLDLGQVWNAPRQVPIPTQQVLDTGNNSSCKTEDILFWYIADGPYQLILLDRSNSYTDVVIKWNISHRAGPMDQF